MMAGILATLTEDEKRSLADALPVIEKINSAVQD
jgi:hypothetical protein